MLLWMAIGERVFRRVLALLLALGVLLAAGCKQELYSNLSEQDANEMTAILLQNEIAASRESDTAGVYTIMVAEDRFAEAVEILKERGYPRQTFATLGEVFSGDGLISSPMEERARFIYALSQELSRTLTEIDGVLSARIHIVLPENDPLKTDLAPSSASVFIRHDERAPVEAVTPKIKMLVANSIEGLVYDKVSLALFPVSAWSKGGDGQPADPKLISLGGIWVHPASAEKAKTVFYALMVLIAGGLAGNLAWFWIWQRRRRTVPVP